MYGYRDAEKDRSPPRSGSSGSKIVPRTFAALVEPHGKSAQPRPSALSSSVVALMLEEHPESWNNTFFVPFRAREKHLPIVPSCPGVCRLGDAAYSRSEPVDYWLLTTLGTQSRGIKDVVGVWRQYRNNPERERGV